MARNTNISGFKRTNPDITVITSADGDLDWGGPIDLLMRTMAAPSGQANWPGRQSCGTGRADAR